jgi:formylglycine-generating enzyme required for sulfatase activity
MKKIGNIVLTLVLSVVFFTGCDKNEDEGGLKSFAESVKGVNFEMCAVEGGTFLMGLPASDTLGSLPGYDKPALITEIPQRPVNVSSYYISKYTVTEGQWKAIMGSYSKPSLGDNFPADVSYNDAVKFIAKLDSLTGKNYRLPTEAEWEYAAKGGKKSHGYKYSGSNNLDEVAWYGGNADTLKAVGLKKPNELGIHDMTGNVWEHCSDWCAFYPIDGHAETNPTGPVSPPNSSTDAPPYNYNYHVIRGGTWYADAWSCRVTYRYNPGARFAFDGFRLVLPAI